MFYRIISRYINKLCGWWQRLVVIARFQCITFNNPNCDKSKRERNRLKVREERINFVFFSVLTGAFQKIPEKDSVVGQCCFTPRAQHVEKSLVHCRSQVLLIKHTSTAIPRSHGQLVSSCHIFFFSQLVSEHLWKRLN